LLFEAAFNRFTAAWAPWAMSFGIGMPWKRLGFLAIGAAFLEQHVANDSLPRDDLAGPLWREPALWRRWQ
jgi:4-hydroxybenzoate polyprenyltransferase